MPFCIWGWLVCVVGALFGFWEYGRCRALPVHESMGKVSNMIWETCKTYLFSRANSWSSSGC